MASPIMLWLEYGLNVFSMVHAFEAQSSLELNGGQPVHGGTALEFTDARLTE